MGKRIGILTQPLKQNYGGILQAYALQLTLKRLGHIPIIIDRHRNKVPLYRKICSHIKTILLRLKGIYRPYTYWPNDFEISIIEQYTNHFISENIYPKSDRIYSNSCFDEFVRNNKFDVFIVGSDQVWRPEYSPNLANYFLDFTAEYTNIIRISYAASFGVENWPLSMKQTKMAEKLISLFKAVSVREDSAVNLCSEYLQIKAEHVLDPTMLLDKQDYIALVEKEDEPKSEGSLFTYILDPSEDKSKLIDDVSEELSLIPFEVFAKQPLTIKNIVRDRISDCVIPPVTKWLRAFIDAEFVITDSFHGCVFSIIFNKPFIVVGNTKRGLARFDSLLNLFDLGYLMNCKKVDFVIDWDRVNFILNKLRNKSLDFLNNNI